MIEGVGIGWRSEVTSATTTRAERKATMLEGNRRAAAWLLGLILTVSGLACTSTRSATTSGPEAAAHEACFNADQVDSFSPLHEMFVYVRTLDNKQYLLTLDGIYVDLPVATGITIAGSFRSVCSDSGARLTFLDAGRPVHARIIRVDAVASKEAAQALVKQRTTAPPKRG
jgi:hypothetical protein